MTTTTAQQPSFAGSAPTENARADWRDPRYQAFALMRLAFDNQHIGTTLLRKMVGNA